MSQDNGQLGVVLVHGGYHGAWCWKPVVDLLAPPAVAVDLPGRGRRPADVASVTLSDNVAAVIADADEAGFDRFLLVGHSMGGVTITETVYLHRVLVAGLIYLSALLPGPGLSAATMLRGGPVDSLPVPPAEVSKMLLATGMSDAAWAEHLERLTPEAHQVLNTPVSGFATEVPTWCVTLGNDPAVPPPLARSMASHLGPDVRYLEIPGAGHTAMETHPSEVAAIIEDARAALNTTRMYA